MIKGCQSLTFVATVSPPPPSAVEGGELEVPSALPQPLIADRYRLAGATPTLGTFPGEL